MDNKQIGRHISRQFNVEMEDIRNKVLTMGGLVEQQLDLAISAFMTGDREQAEQVIQQDTQVNHLEVEIDQECMTILARRQPAAFDLRLLIAIIKLITELERIGDQTERIAETAIHLSDVEKQNQQYYEISHLADLVKRILDRSLDAFARLNVDDILSITAEEEKVNLEYVSIIRQLVSLMMEDPRNIKRTLDVLWTVRALERIADHAINICEYVIYIVKGEDVRHISYEELEKKVQGH